MIKSRKKVDIRKRVKKRKGEIMPGASGVRNGLYDNAEIIENKLNAWLAEYQALRNEIEWLIRDATHYQNSAVALIGVVFAAIGWITQNTMILLIPTLLVIPFLFCLLGFLFLRQHEECYVVAVYIKNDLRPKLRELLSDSDIWGWEEFKAQTWDKLCKGTYINRISSLKFILFLRTCIFVIPSAISLISALSYSLMIGKSNLINLYGLTIIIFFLIVFVIDLCVFILFLIYLTSGCDLSKRSGLLEC